MKKRVREKDWETEREIQMRKKEHTTVKEWQEQSRVFRNDFIFYCNQRIGGCQRNKNKIQPNRFFFMLYTIL